MSFNAEFNFPVPIISKYIKFTIRFRIEHIDQLFSLKEPFDTILNGTKNDNTRLVQYFPSAINKISISISSKKEKKIHQTSSNTFEPIPSIPNIAKSVPVPTKSVQTVTNDDQREATRSNRGERIGNPPSNVLISRKTIIFESTRPPTRARSIRG